MRIETSGPFVRAITGASGLPGAAVGVFAGSPELIGSPFRYSRDEEIYGDGEEADFVYKVISGAVRACKIIGDGRRQINAFYLPGDLFGLEADLHRLTAEAVVDTKVVMFRRGQLERLATSNVDVACQLWSMTAKSLQHAEAHMLLLGRRTALERVAAFLMEMDARFDRAGTIELPMCRRDIADYLGLTLETVSRSMSQLQSERAVTLSGARHVTVDKRVMKAVVED